VEAWNELVLIAQPLCGMTQAVHRAAYF